MNPFVEAVRCPYCHAPQQRLRLAPSIATHHVICETCGRTMTVTVMSHTAWSITVSKRDADSDATTEEAKR
jgi:transposase-like protein